MASEKTKKTIILSRQAIFAEMCKSDPPLVDQQALADKACLNLRSISSAINEHKITAFVAKRIANALLGSQGYSALKKMPSDTSSPTYKLARGLEREIIEHMKDKWLEHGNEFANNNSIMPDGFPLHPELVYRADRTWCGWNVLLGIDPEKSPDNYDMNAERDRLEDIAFKEFEAQYIRFPSWGYGIFENNAALDFINEISNDKSPADLINIIELANSVAYLKYDLACKVLVIAAMAAQQSGYSIHQYPNALAETNHAYDELKDPTVRAKIIEAISKVRNDSELQELRARTGDFELWHTMLAQLTDKCKRQLSPA